jgi:proteasome lid subunit RPN8/RPN11
MSLAILGTELERIREHARVAYPNECCGALLGKEVSAWKFVVEARQVENAQGESPRNRFLITADVVLENERYARRKGLDILGFYHSHPDHPPVPSEHDLENAWPWFSYLIVTVNQGHPGEATSWELAEDRSRFNRETMATAL